MAPHPPPNTGHSCVRDVPRESAQARPRASIAWGPQPGANYSSRPTILALKQPYLAYQIYVLSVGCFVIAAR